VAQEVEHLHSKCEVQTPVLPQKDTSSTKLTFSLDHIAFTLLLGAPFAFGGHTKFSQNGGQETLGRSHKDFNTIDDTLGLTESSFTPTEL
jgi:hypothetical protein